MGQSLGVPGVVGALGVHSLSVGGRGGHLEVTGLRAHSAGLPQHLRVSLRSSLAG